MEQIKIPGSMRFIWGSLGAWWLAHSLNTGFYAISIMLLMLIPVLMLEFFNTSSKKSTMAHRQLPNSEESEQKDSTA